MMSKKCVTSRLTHAERQEKEIESLLQANHNLRNENEALHRELVVANEIILSLQCEISHGKWERGEMP